MAVTINVGEERDVHLTVTPELTPPPPAKADAGRASPLARGDRSPLSAWLIVLTIVIIVSAAHLCVRDPVVSRAAMLAGACLVLWARSTRRRSRCRASRR